MEAQVRIELTHNGFADRSLTTWVLRLKSFNYTQKLYPELYPTRPKSAYLRPMTCRYPIETTWHRVESGDLQTFVNSE